MDTPAAVAAAPSRQTRMTVWLGLILLAALGWAVLIQQSGAMGSASQAISSVPDMSQSTSGTSDMSGMNGMSGMDNMTAATPAPAQPRPTPPSISLLLYLPIWIAMMVAMMFPAVAPMILLFMTLGQNRRAAGQKAAPTWIFLAGYLAVWSLFGVAAYLLSLVLPALGMMAPGLRVDYPVAAGLVLIFAGVYQLSPLKQICLRHCRSPLSIVLHGWHDGPLGSFRMGFEHGAFCLGCCWGLMLVLFVVGLMNLVGMVILSAVIFGEKVVPHGQLIARLSAVALILFGLLTLLMPIIRPVTG